MAFPNWYYPLQKNQTALNKVYGVKARILTGRLIEQGTFRRFQKRWQSNGELYFREGYSCLKKAVWQDIISEVHEELDNILACFTKTDLLIAIFVLAGIMAIESGIIGGLATRVGSLRALFRITAAIANKRANKTTNKTNPPNQHVN